MEGPFSIFKIPLVQSSLWALALALATAIAARVATRILKRYLNQESNPLPSSSIIINIARGVIWATGISVILDACFGVNANALVAALGVGGIAVSLGFQDTLSNLIGGLQVTFMGIVKPGDNIEVGAEAGVVQRRDVASHHHPRRHGADGDHPQLDHFKDRPRASAAGQPCGCSVRRTASWRRWLCPYSAHGRSCQAARHPGARSRRGRLPVIDGPRVLFSEISELGIKGKIILQVEDTSKTSAAADAIVRAIAALV